MSSVDSLSYASEVSNDSSSGSEIHEIPSNQGPTKKSKSKRNKGKGKWRKKKDSSLVNIDTASSLLSKKEFQSSFEKIVDLLEYDGLIAEIKPENEALVNFLSTPATVQVLVCLVIETIEFPSNMNLDSNKFKYKFPYLISEILSMECLSLANSGALNDDTLSLFFSFLKKPDKELEPAKVNCFANIATYFCQTYEEVILDYIQRNPWILDSLLHKLHFYPLANLLLQLHLPPVPLTEGADSSTESVQEMTIHYCYVNDYFLLRHLSEKFDPNTLSHLDESQRQETVQNAAFVFLSLTLRTIPFRECIAIPPELDILCEISLLGSLLSYGLEEANNNLNCLNDSWYSPVLVNALTIIYEILGCLMTGSKSDRWNVDCHYSTALLFQCIQLGRWECSKNTEKLILEIESEIVPKFGQLASLLFFSDDRQKDQLKQKPRLGGLKLKIAEFFMICLVTCSKDTMIEIFNLQIPQWLLTVFVECDMCNILQHQVCALLSFALDKTEQELSLSQKLWILECRVFSWFVDAWELNFISEQQNNIRKGYMGHLILLGNILTRLLDECENEVLELIDDEILSSFERIRDHDLQVENEIQTKEIGGSHPIDANKERKSTKLQVDTLGVDFDQLMGGIISSDVASIHMFSEYLYEDGESSEEDEEEENEATEEDHLQVYDEDDDWVNTDKRTKKKSTKVSNSPVLSPESSLSSRFAQMLAMNASDIVPVSNRKLSVEKNTKPHRESFEKVQDKNEERDILDDDSFLWQGNEEEELVKGGVTEEDYVQSATCAKHVKSKNFMKRRTFLSANQLTNSKQSALQQPSVILRDNEGRAIGSVHSNDHSTSPNKSSPHEKVQSLDKKYSKMKEDTSNKGLHSNVTKSAKAENFIPQLVTQDLTTKSIFSQGKNPIISNASKLYRRKKETVETKAGGQCREEPAWQKDNNDVFSALVRNLMQSSFYKNQNNHSRKEK